MRKTKITAPSKNIPQIKSYIKASTKNQHVVPHHGEWQVKKSGAIRATKQFENQKEAIEYARNIALNNQSELLIHGRNGKIRERSSYGRDPFPSRG